ncbi:uncharacterized protein LOC127277359 [Leptopilina boulardi]|uniref:uncharacterized protein LOC127277359 n=1 Tax=Leptopilina boulardi TaxID=63433 RepID=UPI0021F58826|nr:uncharacterized protein LOC127277359 [Leptopilina boulardi]
MELNICPGFSISEQIIRDIAYLKTEGLGPEEINKITVRIYTCGKRYIGRFGRYFLLSFDNTPQILRCFVKIPPSLNSNEESLVRNLGLFNREAEMYAIVFPKIMKLEDSDIIPKFYYAQMNHVLVIDEMGTNNYQTIGKMCCIGYEHCCCVLKTLARFHARSIIYEEKVSGYSLLDDCEITWQVRLQLRPYDSLMQKYYSGIGHSLTEVFQFIPQLLTLDVKRFIHEFQKAANALFPTITDKEFSSMRVLCHSDLQTSNLLFSYDEDDNPHKCCMIDFQFVKYSSLAYDIWTFLYASADKDLRTERVNDFYQVYYQELAKYLTEGGVDAANIFPYEEYVSLMEKDRVYGMLQGVLAIYHVLHQEVKVKYGPNYRKTWHKIWQNSPEIDSEEYDKIRRLKNRIVESLLELYSSLMNREPSDESDESDYPTSRNISEDESSDVSVENGLRMQTDNEQDDEADDADNDEDDDDDDDDDVDEQMLINFVMHR